MKKIIPALIILALVAAGIYWLLTKPAAHQKLPEAALALESTTLGITTITEDLNVPWEICWGPDNRIWFTEQSGSVSRVDPETGEKKVMITIPEVYRLRSTGLLGMTMHPTEPYLFLDYTHLTKDSVIVSRLVRYTITADTLKDPLIMLEYPGSKGHNGSRVTIAPDGKIILATGDAAQYPNAPDTASLNGKVLRFNIDGTVPADNPYPGNLMWSRGHRNIQGMTYTDKGILYVSEHGDAVDDELNYIHKAGYYGWPHVEGFADRPDEQSYADTFPFINPTFAWTPTIAPAGINFYHSDAIPEWKNTLLLGTLKNASLRVIRLNEAQDSVLGETVYLTNEYGRLRDLCVAPNGDVYLATSNRDWNPGKGFPKEHDDRIIRLSPIKDTTGLKVFRKVVQPAPASTSAKGPALYKSYCEACHKPDGKGIPGSFPSLDKSAIVTGKPEQLLHMILAGSKKNTGEMMPAFAFLSDEDIAQIATYIRTGWSNKASEIIAENVMAERKKVK